MSQGFDPYHKWLGIPPEEQPPDHYRLLAVPRFEDDPDVIEAAADQRMAHLRTYQSGQNSALSQKLLNEVAGAKLCLLNPEKKSRYDEGLRAQEPVGGAGGQPAPAAQVFDLEWLGVTEPAAAGGLTPDHAAPSLRQADRMAAAQRQKVAPGRRLTGWHVALGLLLMAALLVGAIMVVGPFRPPAGSPLASGGAGGGSAPGSGAAESVAAHTAGQGLDEKTPDTRGENDLVEVLRTYAPTVEPGPLAHSPLGRNLVLHMSFDRETIDQRGEVLLVKDLSGLGNHGAGRGLKFIPQGKLGGAIELGDSPLRLRRGLLNRQAEYTVAVWVYLPSDAETWWFNEHTTKPLLGIAAGGGVSVRGWSKNRPGGGLLVHLHTAPVPAGQWNFLAVRRQQLPAGHGRLRVTVNDRSYNASDRFPMAEDDLESFVRLGNSRGVRLDELAVFQRYLPDEEIGALRARKDPAAPPELARVANVAPGPAGPLVRPGPAAGVISPGPATPAVSSQPAGPFAPPVPIEPVAGASLPIDPLGAANPPWLFRWTPVAGAQFYEVSATEHNNPKTSMDFPRLVGNICHLTLNGLVPENHRHGWQWQVRASVGGHWTEWSQPRNFELVPAGSGGAGVPAGPETPSVATSRLPLPDEAMRQKAFNLVREMYKKRYAEARSREALLALSAEMVGQAGQTQHDPAGRFVLLDRARAVAAEAGDPRTALQIIDQTAREFAIDAPRSKADTLTQILKLPGQPHGQGQAVDAGAQVMAELGAADQYDTAIELGNLIRDRVRRPADPAALKRIATLLKVLKEAKQEYGKIEQARALLKTNPGDAEANAAVGRFLCLGKADWAAGLPLLARGTAGPLKELAVQDQAQPTDAAARLKLADAWYDRAAAEGTASARLACLGRAKYWYQTALPGLTGLERAKAEKRIESLDR
ncbi:MAG: LamG-like jellyroll fold domain-containing protein [Thermoguttaceae bacterium]|jgi:hypothetical protein